jgi:hypothetical protein
MSWLAFVAGVGTGIVLWVWQRRRRRRLELGTVSEAWLANARRSK